MDARQISPGRLRALQTLYGIYAARSLDVTGGDARAERLAWASRNVGRRIASFRDLSDREAGQLVDLLKTALGQEVTPPRRRRSPRPRSRQGAEACGMEGRRDSARPPSMATPEVVAPIEDLWRRLGWTRERFEAWLASPSSPIGQGGNPALLTLAIATACAGR